MPVYDYKCKEHGLFHELGTMENSGDPKPCPQCRAMSARIVMIPPEILNMASEKRLAMQTNEEAQHQPIISTADSRAEAADRVAYAHKHGHSKQSGGCGCSSEHKPENSALKQQVIFLPDGSKVFPSQRPWMISH